MPKRTDIGSIMIIGAGPIVIGKACEFDYSCAQACTALGEEGYRVIRYQTARGSSPAQNSASLQPSNSPSATGRTPNTPPDRTPSSKTYSLRRYREMGAMKQDCTTTSGPMPPMADSRSPWFTSTRSKLTSRRRE